MSTMTTEFAAPVSRTQMNFSLSIVRLVKEMHCGLTPALVSCWGDGKGASGQSRGARARDLGAIFVSSENSGCRSITYRHDLLDGHRRGRHGGLIENWWRPPVRHRDFRSRRAFHCADPTAAGLSSHDEMFLCMDWARVLRTRFFVTE